MIPSSVLEAYGFQSATVEPLIMGNINDTFVVQASARWIVQRLNPIFSPQVHLDIDAITARLAERGLTTPRLKPTAVGKLWVTDSDGGVWRTLSYVEGIIHHSAPDRAACESAGALLARFHRALGDLDHTFAASRLGVHDTSRHLANLRDALATHAAHPWFQRTQPVATEILARAEALTSVGEHPERIVHGDPKLNNIIFVDGAAECLIDLDTVARMALPLELGDAMRSWCNPSREDDEDAELSLPFFEAALRGYWREAAGFVSAAEMRAVLAATETIILELAARFCADVLQESYFGYNPEKYGSAPEHHYVRAAAQLRLARSFDAQRDGASAALERVLV